MKFPSSPAAAFGLRKRERVVIGHGWFHKLMFIVAPLCFCLFAVWGMPRRVDIRCETRTGDVACEVETHYLTRDVAEHGLVTPRHRAYVEERGSGSDRSYYLALGEPSVKMSRGAARERTTTINGMLSAPRGTSRDLTYKPWSLWVSLACAVGFMFFGAWSGRSAIVELDPGSGVVRVLRSAIFGPPRVIERLARGDVRAVLTTEDSGGDSTSHGICLRVKDRSLVEVIANVGSKLDDDATRVAKMLGVEREARDA